MKTKIIPLAALSLILAGCGESSSMPDVPKIETTEATKEETTRIETTTQIIETTAKKQKEYEIDQSKKEVAIDIPYIFNADDGNKYLIVTYKFYNKDKREKTFAESFYTHVYRDGNEIGRSYLEFKNYDYFSSPVMPGTSKDISLAYKLSDFDEANPEIITIMVLDPYDPERVVEGVKFKTEKLYVFNSYDWG